MRLPVTFSDCQHVRPPTVTSSAFTRHAKTSLKAPPTPTHITLWKYTLLLTYRTIKPLKAALASWQPYVLNHTPLGYEYQPPPSALSLSASHANAVSGSITLDWIDAPPAPLLTKALSDMVSYRELMLNCHYLGCWSTLSVLISAAVAAVATQFVGMNRHCWCQWRPD